jgi:hypothetical protein
VTSVDKGLQDVLLDSEIIVADGHHLASGSAISVIFEPCKPRPAISHFLGKEKGIDTLEVAKRERVEG